VASPIAAGASVALLSSCLLDERHRFAGLCIGSVGVAHLTRDGFEPTLCICVVVGYLERLREPENCTELMAKPADGVFDKFVVLLAFRIERIWV